jgi:hypothetical protein
MRRLVKMGVCCKKFNSGVRRHPVAAPTIDRVCGAVGLYIPRTNALRARAWNITVQA